MPSRPVFTAPAPWQSGIEGARANLAPGIALQAAALILVLGYYRLPALHAALGALAVRREEAGVGFSIATTAVAGGILPFLYLHYRRSPSGAAPRYTWAQGAALVVFWAYKGLEVDRWYLFQAWLFGRGHGAGTIAIKVLCDQFGYCPALAVPVTAAVYEFVDGGLGRAGWNRLRRDWAEGSWYRRRTLPLLISNLAVWIPAVAIIYALPLPLQLPLQNLVLCFYTLIVAHQTGRRAGPRFESSPATP